MTHLDHCNALDVVLLFMTGWKLMLVQKMAA